MQLNYNPKAFLGGPGCSTQAIFDIWKGAADQIIFEGAWTYEQNADVKAYYDKLAAFVGGPANVDFWGALIYKAQLDFFGQAIEKAGTLDQAKVAEVMRTEHFKTLMSDDTFFTNQILDGSCYAGQIGQWQNGVPQVIDVGAKRTAASPCYPEARPGRHHAGLASGAGSVTNEMRVELSRSPGAPQGAPGGDLPSQVRSRSSKQRIYGW